MNKSIIKGLLLCLMMLCTTTQADAQLNQIFNKVISAVTGQNKVSEKNIVGTWTFVGSGLEFTSKNNNILKDLGGTAATVAAEKKLDSYLSKVGITKDKFVITFAEDKTVTVTTDKGKTHTGTYAITDGNVVLKMSSFGNGVTCMTDVTAKTLKLMVKADGLITLASTLSSIGIASSKFKTIDKLLQNFDGVNAGLQFSR